MAGAEPLTADVADALWDQIDKELGNVKTPPMSPGGSRPGTNQGSRQAGTGAETLAQATARRFVSAPHAGHGSDDEAAGGLEGMAEALDQVSTLRKTLGAGSSTSRPKQTRRLDADPNTNHVLEMGPDGQPVAAVKDTTAIRLAFLHYCGSKMRPPEMQRLLEHGMAGPFMTAPKLMAMCKQLDLWQPKGPLSFKVVGEIFANFKNEEVQGLLYPAFLEVLVDMMLEGNVNIAATLEKLHAPRPEVERAGSPAGGRLDKNLCLGGVDELVQGLPSLRTTTRGPSLTGTSDLSGTGMLPLPGVSPQPRFARVAPLLKSPSIGRLFTHMQLRELTDSTRRSASHSDAGGGGGYKQNASEPGFIRNPGATPFGASPSRPGSVQSSGEGGLPPLDGKPGSVQLPPGPPGARPNGMTQRRPSPRSKLVPSLSIKRTIMLRSSLPDQGILAAANQSLDAGAESDGAEAHPLHQAVMLTATWGSRSGRMSDPGAALRQSAGHGATRLGPKTSAS